MIFYRLYLLRNHSNYVIVFYENVITKLFKYVEISNFWKFSRADRSIRFRNLLIVDLRSINNFTFVFRHDNSFPRLYISTKA